MFNFTHVLDVTTKQRYYIDRAQLANDEGYDEAPDGTNVFQIDLQPENPDVEPITDVDLVVSNNGYSVQISKNLDCSTGMQDGDTFHAELMDALVEGKTLIVSTEQKSA